MFLWTALLGAGLGSTQLILITGKLLFAIGCTMSAVHPRAQNPAGLAALVSWPILSKNTGGCLQEKWTGRCSIFKQERLIGGDFSCAGLNQKLGLSNELFVLGDSLVLTVLGQVSFMPILVLAARLCPEVCLFGLRCSS
jgi:hypothetical protein